MVEPGRRGYRCGRLVAVATGVAVEVQGPVTRLKQGWARPRLVPQSNPTGAVSGWPRCVLRYFESREAVLLELLDHFLREWLTELAGELATGIDENLPMAERATAVAEILSRSLSGRVVLCDLFGAQGGVLEHNVSVEVVARYKRASLDRLTTMTALTRKYLPELGEHATLFSLQTMVMAGALSAYSSPPPSLQAAYQAEPALARFHLELKDSLKLALTRNPAGRATPPLTCSGRPATPPSRALGVLTDVTAGWKASW